MSRDGLTRLSVNMNAETTEALRQIATEQGISYTEAIRRAISMLAFVRDIHAAGETLIVESADRKQIRKVIVL